MDADLLKKLLETFSAELSEQTHVITQGLLTIEKMPDDEAREKTLATIFRAAHNIKGTSRSLGIAEIGDIAHQLESLFSELQKKTKDVTATMISECLVSIDKMLALMQAKMGRGEQAPTVIVSAEVNDEETIRVSVKSVERISALMEEMQSNKIAMADYYDELSSSMKNQVNQFTILSDALQDEVRTLRLVPAAMLLSQMPRYVRDLCQSLDKQVDLTIKGEEVKLDKMVLEKLKDPLIHLIRNSLDHGIEQSEARVVAGKSAVGHIQIEIKEQSGKIYLSLHDDGAGIDTKKVREAVEKRHLASASELDAMSEEEMIQFIFKPGFSTARLLTDISGRGVGLDIVAQNMAELKGTIDVKTVPGQGTTFYLCAPLTLESERGLMVKVNGTLYAIPTLSLHSVLSLSMHEVVEVEGRKVVMLNHRPVPLYLLTALLQLEQRNLSDNEQLMVVVVEQEGELSAILVDDIVGEKEMVIKPLQEPLSKLPCVAGGTLLGNNQVMLVLDTASLLAETLQAASADHSFFASKQVVVEEAPHILVVDDSITTRTLEKNVLESRHYRVTVAVNGSDAWDLLQKESYDLVITDVNMPVMDGFTLTERVKQSDKLRHTPVIIVTSLGSDLEKKRGMDVGADAYIVKNEFESGALLQIVEQLI